MALDTSTLREISVSNGIRFINYLIDCFVIGFLLILVMAGFFSMRDNSESAIDTFTGALNLWAYLLWFLYYFFMEAYLGGRTIGKMVTGSIVVNKDGLLPTPANIAGRTLCRFIPFDIISFIFTRGWHDSIPDVYVVDKRQWENAKTIEKNMEDIGRFGSENVQTVAW